MSAHFTRLDFTLPDYQLPKFPDSLADHAQLARHEVVRRPGAAQRHLAAFQLAQRAVVAVLIFLHCPVIDKVGDVDHHPAGIDALAADFGVERVEHLLHLHTEGPGLALTLAI